MPEQLLKTIRTLLMFCFHAVDERAFAQPDPDIHLIFKQRVVLVKQHPDGFHLLFRMGQCQVRLADFHILKQRRVFCHILFIGLNAEPHGIVLGGHHPVTQLEGRIQMLERLFIHQTALDRLQRQIP